MISLRWQKHLTEQAPAFPGLTLLYVLQQWQVPYQFNALPCFHFAGRSIEEIVFETQCAKIRHYDLSMMSVDSLLPVHYSLQYWRIEREGTPNVVTLLLKVLEQRHYEQFLRSVIHYKPCFNKLMFQKTAEALVGAFHETEALTNLLLRYSSYAMKKGIASEDLIIVLAHYLNAQVAVTADQVTYSRLPLEETSRVGKHYGAIGQTLLLGKGIYQIGEHLIVTLTLPMMRYDQLIRQKAEMDLLVSLIQRLVNKSVGLELRLFLQTSDRCLARLGKTPLGVMGWLPGEVAIDTPRIITKELV